MPIHTTFNHHKAIKRAELFALFNFVKLKGK